jgi:hypothetical protein
MFRDEWRTVTLYPICEEAKSDKLHTDWTIIQFQRFSNALGDNVNSATRPLQMMKRMNKRKVDGGYHTFGLVRE